MKILYKILGKVLDSINNSGIDYANLNKQDFKKIAPILDQLPYIIWITGPINPYFINLKARNYYGISLEEIRTEQNQVYTKFLHPDTFFLVNVTNQSFAKDPSQPVYTCYKVYNLKKETRWILNITQALQLNNNGGVVYSIHVALDLGEALEKSSLIVSTNYSSTLHLTDRELEILKLISKEKTSMEISEKLFIGKDAVNFHRKNLIKKLHVKSSVGLVLKAKEFNLI